MSINTVPSYITIRHSLIVGSPFDAVVQSHKKKKKKKRAPGAKNFEIKFIYIGAAAASIFNNLIILLRIQTRGLVANFSSWFANFLTIIDYYRRIQTGPNTASQILPIMI